MKLYSLLSSGFEPTSGYRAHIDTLRVIDTAEPLSLTAALAVARAYFRGQRPNPVRARRWGLAPAHGWDIHVGVLIPNATNTPIDAVQPPALESTLVSDVTSLTPTLCPWDLANVYNFCPRIERLLGACGDCTAQDTCIDDLVWPAAPAAASVMYEINYTGRKSAPGLFFHSSRATLEGYRYVAPAHLPWSHGSDLEKSIVTSIERASEVAKQGRATVQRGLTICPSCIFAGPKGKPCDKWQIRRCAQSLTEADLAAAVRRRAALMLSLLKQTYGFTVEQRHALMRASGAEVAAAPGSADLWRRSKRGCLGHFHAGQFRVFSTRPDFHRYQSYSSWESLVEDFPEVAAMPQHFQDPVPEELEVLYALASMYQSRGTGWGRGRGSANLRVLEVTGRHIDGYYANSTFTRTYPTYTLSANSDPEVLWSVYSRVQGYTVWDRTELLKP